MKVIADLLLVALPWIGLLLLLRGLIIDRRKSLAWRATMLLLGGAMLAVSPPWSREAGWSMPIAWLAMPFQAWATFVCLAIASARLFNSLLSVEEPRRKEQTRSALMWGLAGAGFLAFQIVSHDAIKLFQGRIPLTLGWLLGLFELAVITAWVISWLGRLGARRRWPAVITVHGSLAVGSVVFGLPFVWMLLTSFKEQRDMSADTGLVWVPKVEQTTPYNDPNDPLFETRYQGTRVEVSVAGRSGETAEVLIQRPGSLHGIAFKARTAALREIPKQIPIVRGQYDGIGIVGKVIEELPDGHRRVRINEPSSVRDREFVAEPAQVQPVEQVGLKWANYSDALEGLPPETANGLVYVRNTLLLVLLNLVGTLLSSSLVAYAFARLRFPGRTALFMLLLSTMMLPAAVTLLPSFLIYRSLGWVDTLFPLWVPAFFGSAFNIFMLRQFFLSLPSEFEDSAEIDGCGHLRTYWSVVLPQIRPALVVIALWTFIGTWGNFMGPLIYINSIQKMPIAYGMYLFAGDKIQFPGQLMAFATMAMLPVVLIFFLAQRYFVDSVALSGLKA